MLTYWDSEAHNRRWAAPAMWCRAYQTAAEGRCRLRYTCEVACRVYPCRAALLVQAGLVSRGCPARPAPPVLLVVQRHPQVPTGPIGPAGPGMPCGPVAPAPAHGIRVKPSDVSFPPVTRQVTAAAGDTHRSVWPAAKPAARSLRS